MTVTAIIGKPRQGKTLFMTMTGHEDFKRGRKIFSNYKLNFPHERVSISDILSIRLLELERSSKTLLIQEADKWFDSRRSGKEENRLLSSVTGQSGKRNIDIMVDTQFYSRLDKGIRDVIDVEVWCKCEAVNNVPLYFEYQVLDLHEFTHRQIVIPEFIMKQYYSMYDTYEITQPLITEKKEKKKEKVYY